MRIGQKRGPEETFEGDQLFILFSIFGELVLVKFYLFQFLNHVIDQIADHMCDKTLIYALFGLTLIYFDYR